MTVETRKEFKTESEEVHVYKCDYCGFENEDPKETHLVRIYERAEADHPGAHYETLHLCNDCVGLRDAIEIREERERIKARWKGIVSALGGVNPISSLLLISIAFGSGYAFAPDGDIIALLLLLSPLLIIAVMTAARWMKTNRL